MFFDFVQVDEDKERKRDTFFKVRSPKVVKLNDNEGIEIQERETKTNWQTDNFIILTNKLIKPQQAISTVDNIIWDADIKFKESSLVNEVIKTILKWDGKDYVKEKDFVIGGLVERVQFSQRNVVEQFKKCTDIER